MLENVESPTKSWDEGPPFPTGLSQGYINLIIIESYHCINHIILYYRYVVITIIFFTIPLSSHYFFGFQPSLSSHYHPIIIPLSSRKAYHPINIDMGVSTNGGIPKWMVSSGKSQSKMDNLGVPPFQETSIYQYHYPMIIP